MEGQTEKWYFEHLQKLINDDENIPYKVKFEIKINHSVISSAKNLTLPYKMKAFHICDYESKDMLHIEQFKKVLEELKNVRKINKNLSYKLGYSNLTFDLWIILHKKMQRKLVNHRKNYIADINLAYNENFETIDKYKEEENFKKVLEKITLQDVKTAIKNGNEIRKFNEENNNKERRSFGQVIYYLNNPDVTINECVEQILNECGVV